MCQETIDPTDTASDPQPNAPQPQPTPTLSLQLSLCTSRFFPPHLRPPQLLAPRTSSPLPEREPPPVGRVGRPRLPPPPPRRPPPHGGRGSARRRPARCPSTRSSRRSAMGGCGGRFHARRGPPRAPGPRRAAPGGALRSLTPLRAGGGPGPDELAHSGRPGEGVPARAGASPTCGRPRRAVWLAA